MSRCLQPHGTFILQLFLALALGLVPACSTETDGHGAPDAASDALPDREVPRSHPRLLATAEELPVLRQRFSSPENQQLADYIREIASYDNDGYLPDGQPDDVKAFIFYAKAVLYRLEERDDVGREAVDMALAYLQSLDANYEDGGLFVSRSLNRSLERAAFVYDWCYDLLTEEERSSFIEEALRVAGNTEYGWPPASNALHFVGGHYCEEKHPVMLALGIALYDEYPSVYEVASTHLKESFAPVRNLVYEGHRHHQGSSYGKSRFLWEVYSAMYASKLNAPSPYTADQAQVPYYDIYTRMPTGYPMPEGDDWLFQFPPGRDSLLVPYYLASTHSDGHLLDYVNRIDSGGDDRIAMFLVGDPDLEPASVDSLPLSRYFGSPFGTMVARTDWDMDGGMASGVAAARMTIKEYQFGNHDHLDAGHFSFYYKGNLAIDSGSYSGSTYGGPHHFNYNQRSVAHNTILVLDPNEPLQRAYKGGPTLARDGGQLWVYGRPGSPVDLPGLQQKYKRSEILAHSMGPASDRPRFSYLKGDIAGAYAAPAPYPAKVESARRSFVFINLESADNPAALVVYDVVQSANASFEKRWLLHSTAEPEVDDNITTVVRTDSGFNGKLVNHTLLPEAGNRNIIKVGGPGKEFWVDGKNYPVTASKKSPEAGAWRVELSPSMPAKEDRFLNVMQVVDATRAGGAGPAPLQVTLVDAPLVVGPTIGGKVVLFGRTGKLIDQAVTFTTPPSTGPMQFHVADLEQGTWAISSPGGMHSSCEVGPVEQTCWFTGPAGSYELTPL